MESTMPSLRRPTRQAFDAFRQVVDNCDNSGKPYPVLLGQSVSLWNERESLVALRRPTDEDRLTMAPRKCFPFLFMPEKHAGGRIALFSEERIRKAVAFISMMLAAGLLHDAILNLYFVTSDNAKLGLIAAYNTAFALCVTIDKCEEIRDICCLCRIRCSHCDFCEQWLRKLDWNE
jgi:hypothetical protein